MNLKKTLKFIKLHEREIVVFAGILILLVAGIFVIRYLSGPRGEVFDVQSPNPSQGERYVVLKGDTLWSISEKYYKKGSDWKKIADANNISEPSKIKVGQSLIIPLEKTENTEAHSPTPQISKQAASTTNEITGNSYVVVKGDSLWKIAVRAYGDGKKWIEIARANKLHNPNLIHSGNVFIIPR